MKPDCTKISRTLCRRASWPFLRGLPPSLTLCLSVEVLDDGKSLHFCWQKGFTWHFKRKWCSASHCLPETHCLPSALAQPFQGPGVTGDWEPALWVPYKLTHGTGHTQTLCLPSQTSVLMVKTKSARIRCPFLGVSNDKKKRVTF